MDKRTDIAATAPCPVEFKYARFKIIEQIERLSITLIAIHQASSPALRRAASILSFVNGFTI